LAKNTGCEARRYKNFSNPPLLFFSCASLVISSVPEQLLASPGVSCGDEVQDELGGACSTHEVDRNGYVIIVGKSKEKRYLHGMIVLKQGVGM
jgi:hypothetical protein